MRNTWSERRDRRQSKAIQDHMDKIVTYGSAIPNLTIHGSKMTLHFSHWLPKKNAVVLMTITRKNNMWFIESSGFLKYRIALGAYGTSVFWKVIEEEVKKRVSSIKMKNQPDLRSKRPKRRYKR